MDWLAVAGLAALQGATEFLPVSSSGHLALAERLLGVSSPPLLFNVSLHVGTLAAVIVHYRRGIAVVIAAGFRWLVRTLRTVGRDGAWRPADDDEREAIGIVAATLVTGVIAALFQGPLEAAASHPRVLGALFLAAAAVLALTRLARPGTAPITLPRALWIGLAQAAAILPGISRSGLTVAVALFAGVERDRAARFSFLVSIPAIAGAEALGLAGGLSGASVPAAQHVAGAAVAAVTGFAALTLFVHVVRRGGLHWFALYLAPLGAAVMIFAR